MTIGQRVAVVLFNLGGPDSLDAVRPFLFNLFYDPAIIAVPKPLRWLLAQMVSRRRAPIAREIYAHMGGASPLLPNTALQASALEAQLGPGFKTFLAMRYWHPRAAETVKQVAAWKPDTVLLLPLYPQFSTTTTGSSVLEWSDAASRVGLNALTKMVCCWPREPGFIDAVVNRVRDGLAQIAALSPLKPKLLFTAHGLPEQVITRGDSYQWQVEQTVEKIVTGLDQSDLDYQLCYQSRVGPMKWIGPSTEMSIREVGSEGRPVVVVPVAFVSEHSETLVELDIEYRHLADSCGVPAYIRVPTVDILPDFIAGLSRSVRAALSDHPTICSAEGRRLCPAGFARCAMGH